MSGTLTMKEATQRTGYSQGWLRRLLGEGRLRGEIVGSRWIIDAADLDAHLARMAALGNRKNGLRRTEVGE